MNKMFMTFRCAPAREEFAADEAAYCDRFGLSEAQKRAVLERDSVRCRAVIARGLAIREASETRSARQAGVADDTTACSA
jgi:hypothetical protein